MGSAAEGLCAQLELAAFEHARRRAQPRMLAFAAASSAAAGANSTATSPTRPIRRLGATCAGPTRGGGSVHGAGGATAPASGRGPSSDLAEAEFVQLSMAASVEGCAVRARRDIADSAAHEVLDMLQTGGRALIKTLGQTIVMQILSPFILSFVTALMPAINEMLAAGRLGLPRPARLGARRRSR